jgi:hypothetical protein
MRRNQEKNPVKGENSLVRITLESCHDEFEPGSREAEQNTRIANVESTRVFCLAALVSEAVTDGFSLVELTNAY